MATYPSGIYNPTNPTSTSPRNNPSLAGEISGLNGEVVAIETALGANLSGVTAEIAAASVGVNPNAVFFGFEAGANQVASVSPVNTFIGYQSGGSVTNGTSNTMVGYQSGVTAGSVGAATTGARQTNLGFRAGPSTSGAQINDIVCVGSSAQTTSTDSISIGSGAVSGGSSIAIGSAAGATSSTLSNSVAIGYQSAKAGVTAGSSVFIGYQSAAAGGVISNSVMIGYQAGFQSVNANATVVGYAAGSGNTTHSNITCLGYQTLVTADGGVAIGVDHTGVSAATSTQDQFVLGTLRHKVVAPGNIAVGTASSPASVGTIATAPPSSASVATPSIGVPFQNPLGYDAQFVVTIAVTAATSATMNVGVNSASVSTAQPLLTSFTTAAFVPVIVPLYIPAGYYGVVQTGGTITATVDSCIAMPI